jgi:hypothetical protein
MADPISAVATVASGAIASRASRKSTRAQVQAAEQQRALEKEMFDRQVELQEPFRQLGLQNLNRLAALYGEGGAYAAAPTMAEIQMDPGYGFRLAEGQKALERSAAARGNLLSGGTGKALTRYGQEMGSQEYMNAFNRYQTERQARLNPLQSLANVGQTSSQQLAGQAGQFGSNMAEAIGAGGQARASGYMGTANAITGGLNQYLNYSQNQAQNQLLQQALASGRYNPANFANIGY